MNEISDSTRGNYIPQIIRIDKKYVESMTTILKCEEIDIKSEPLSTNTSEDIDGLTQNCGDEDIQVKNEAIEEDNEYDDDQDCSEIKQPASMKSHSLKQKRIALFNNNMLKNKVCQDCDLIFPTQKLLREHLITNHSESRFICNKCKETFIHEASLIKHKCYECNFCGKIISHKFRFHRHLITHQTGKDLRSVSFNFYECNSCSKIFRDKAYLKRHIERVHCGLKYSCQQCGKRYTTQRPCSKCQPEILNIKCPVCERDITRTHWQKHVRNVHQASTKNKQYLCLLCKKDFSGIDGWIKHLRSKSHTKANKGNVFDKYSCPLCGKLIKRKAHLNNHIKCVHYIKVLSHQFDCLLCHEILDDVVITKEHIQSRSHLSKVNDAKPKCHDCGKTFSCAKAMQSHMLSVHS